MLVLAPTRELAHQIQEEAIRYGIPGGIKSVCCTGGASRDEQKALITNIAHIMVGTPGIE